MAQGGRSFNNLLEDSRVTELRRVDFAAHAAAMGCEAINVNGIADLDSALERARRSSGTTVICIRTDPHAWTEGGAFWEVGVPEVSERVEVMAARRELEAGKSRQRVGW